MKYYLEKGRFDYVFDVHFRGKAEYWKKSGLGHIEFVIVQEIVFVLTGHKIFKEPQTMTVEEARELWAKLVKEGFERKIGE